MKKMRRRQALFILVFLLIFISACQKNGVENMIENTNSIEEKNHPSLLAKSVYGGAHATSHMQGLTIDNDTHDSMFFSFTTLLVKTDMDGNELARVEGLKGHLGCIDYYDGKIYGSLERHYEDSSFHIAIFDVDTLKMEIVSLKEVTDDYKAKVTNELNGKRISHRYGCSGIDGVTIGTVPGQPLDSEKKLFVAYGIYGDTTRNDNDYQVILQYSLDNFEGDSYANPEAKTPEIEAKYFVYTGNTTYGIQNLEYDLDTGDLWLSVYRGTKKEFENFSLFRVDSSKAPVKELVNGEEQYTLSLKKNGEKDGWFCDATTGLSSLGDGYFYLPEIGSDINGKQFGYAIMHIFDESTPFARIAD